jgi:hypothetical protein
MPTFHVQLDSCPAREIEADDSTQAWELYRAEMGFLKSRHQPTISEVTVEAVDVVPERGVDTVPEPTIQEPVSLPENSDSKISKVEIQPVPAPAPVEEESPATVEKAQESKSAPKPKSKR